MWAHLGGIFELLLINVKWYIMRFGVNVLKLLIAFVLSMGNLDAGAQQQVVVDNSFGVNGGAMACVLNGEYGEVTDENLAIQTDGKIVLVGSGTSSSASVRVMRFNSDGLI